MKKAVFPGSFDPITIGHEALVRRAIPLFDEIVVAIGHNSNKQYMYPLEQRQQWIADVFADAPSVSVATYQGLTTDYCQSINAGFLLRGLRSSTDFEFERSIAQMNRAISDGLETVFLITDPEHSAINSTIIRDIVRNGGNADAFVPKQVNLSI